jgi:hypothetical protein
MPSPNSPQSDPFTDCDFFGVQGRRSSHFNCLASINFDATQALPRTSGYLGSGWLRNSGRMAHQEPAEMTSARLAETAPQRSSCTIRSHTSSLGLVHTSQPIEPPQMLSSPVLSPQLLV